jgi:predicted Zn-dependent protease
VKDPDNADLAKLEVELADDRGDLAAALDQVRRAQNLQPANFALTTDEAIKLARLGRFGEAERLLLATAGTCTPRDLDKMTPAIADFYTRTKRFADGRTWFEQAMVRHPGSQPLRFYRGRLALAAGDLKTAESDDRAVLVAQPANETALESLVALLHGQGRTKELEELCLQHARLQPDNQANQFRAAQILEARGQPTEAAKALLDATRSGPVPLPVRLRLANLLYTQGRQREALDQLATAWRLSLDEDDREVTTSIRELIGRIRAGK